MVALNTAQFRDVAEPILNVVFDGIYNQKPKQYSKVFKVIDGIKRASHEEPLLGQFGLAVVKGQGDTVTYDESSESGVARAVYVVYALAYSVTEELMEDADHMGILSVYTEHLANSMRYTKELVGANVLNNGFSSSFTGYDGQPLFSASHGPNSNQSNTLANATALSQAGLEQMLIGIDTATDSRGKIIELEPELLVIPPQLRYIADRVISSPLQYDTGNNAINPLKDVLEPFVMHRLTSPTAFFIKTDAPRGLMCAERRAINTQSLGDFESGNMRYRSNFRNAFFWTDPYGAWGTAGL